MVKHPFSAIRKDTLRIAKASAAHNHWAVLGIPHGSDYKKIKLAHRKWIRKLHPDRWFATADPHLYNEIQEAFYQVQVAYFETLKHCAAANENHHGPITVPSPASGISAENRLLAWLQRLFERVRPSSSQDASLR